MTPQETLSHLRTLTDPTPGQLREASDLALLATGWRTETYDTPFGETKPHWVEPDAGPWKEDLRPHPCVSIDDAVRWIVPEGWWLEMSGPYQDDEWIARMEFGEVWHKKLRSEGLAKSPALALTIAGLSATLEGEK